MTGWVDKADLDEFVARGPLHLLSVGYVLRDDEQSLVIVESVPKDPTAGKQWGSVMCIPRSAVRKVAELRHDLA